MRDMPHCFERKPVKNCVDLDQTSRGVVTFLSLGSENKPGEKASGQQFYKVLQQFFAVNEQMRSDKPKENLPSASMAPSPAGKGQSQRSQHAKIDGTGKCDI